MYMYNCCVLIAHFLLKWVMVSRLNCDFNSTQDVHLVCEKKLLCKSE